MPEFPRGATQGQSADAPAGEPLDSWKEIAAYLRRDVRTVQRWEKREALPVYRHVHDKLGSVYAYRAELDAWWTSRRQQLEPQVLPEGERTTPQAEGSLPPDAVPLSSEGAPRRSDSDEGVLLPNRANSAAPTNRWVWAFLLALGLAAAGSAYVWVSNRSTPAKAGVAITSLAVLPFKPLVTEARDESLEVGMADALITRLSNLRQVHVRPTSAVLRYTDPAQNLETVGRQLRVDSVLDGRIQISADRIRVTVQLIRVRDGAPLWAGTFDERFTNIFAVQDSISEKVTQALMLTLTRGDRERLIRQDTESPEAYQYYLKGRYFWNKRTEDGFRRAIEQFQQATEKDPNYALAYAGLADCYALLNAYHVAPPRDSAPKAKAAAVRALEIDPSLTEAHTTLGFVKLYYDWDWAGAEKEFERAIELNPNYATARQWYAWYFSVMRRFDEAIAEKERAQELDPVSLIINAEIGQVLYFARQRERAIGALQKTIEMDPNFVRAHWLLGLVYAQTSMHEKAVTELKRAVELSGGATYILASLGYVYARSGEKDEAQRVLDQLKMLSSRRYVSPYAIATIYSGLGEKDQAFKWLDKAYAERTDKLAELNVEPMVDGLRSDPRFADLLRRVGLP